MPESDASSAPDDSTLFEEETDAPQNGIPQRDAGDAPTDGLSIERVFSTEGTHPFDEFDWDTRDAAIKNQQGEAIFEQKGVEFPEHFSQLATNIVASKYFYGDLDDQDVPPEEGGRETSLRELVDRVTRTITDWGKEQDYFASEEEAETFYDELTWLTVNQYGAFNSPVWFNVGLAQQYGTRDTGDKKIYGWDPTAEHVVEVDPYVNPQASACFIISVDDSIDDIWQLMGESARLFKFGSGVGADWSTLRSTKEKLSGGGVPSGPVSFMRVQDETGDTIKSGGKTRRAAIMQTLKCWHPDVLEFVEAKQTEEKKAHALVDQGYDGSFNGPAYGSVAFQNVNQSLRVTDEFMEAAENGESYDLTAVTTGETVDQIDAAELLHKVGEGTYVCGDPGLQYEDTMQHWHTCKNTAPINSSNPCSEYLFLDDSACNLASLNFRKYQREDGTIDVERLRAAARIFITAQEILVDNAGYPSHDIAENSHKFRPLGLGFANVGALLMSLGLPYDSDEGRAVAGAMQAIVHSEAYARSAEIAANDAIGPFEGYAENEEPMLEVMRRHENAVQDIDQDLCPDYLFEAAEESAARMVENGEKWGYRNAQATVIAPTGCLVENSLVSTDRGLVRLGTLGDTEGAEWQDTSFRVFTDEGPQEATKFYVNGEAQTRKIRTSAGYTIQGTCKHKVKVVDPNTGHWTWKRFDAIEEGDIVPLAMNTLVGEAREVALPPRGEMHWNADFTTRTPSAVTPELAELVGYFMGDGSLHAKGLRFCVAEEDADVATRIDELAQELFGLETYVEEQKGYLEVGIHSVPLTRWWEACGFDKLAPGENHEGKGYQPRIPDAVLHTNDPDVYGAFLRGLFEADGTLLSGVPALCTGSRAFASEVRSLMLALGYPTHTRGSESGWGGTMQMLRLKNRSYNAPFRREVGFMGARKQEGIRSAATRTSAKGDRVYVGRELIDEVVPAGSEHRNAVLTSMRRHDGGVARQRLEQVYEDTGDERLVRYMGFFYDTVEANEDGGVQPTYDLSVPENVTYTAGGFISHNTIGFYMDCDTTGIEPDIALVKYKLLAGEGEGMFKIVNQTVPEALERLGYPEEEREAIIAYIDEEDTIEGAPHLKDEDLPVFDCAFEPANGERSIHHMGHIRMMAAVQPFVSGAISKTVNVPEDASPDDIADAYRQGWELGLKAIAIYRENSKRSQPLSTSSGEEDEESEDELETAEGAPAGDGAPQETPATKEPVEAVAGEGEDGSEDGVVYKPVRKRLPDERPSLTHKFSIAGHEGYLTIGLYPESEQPGEIFITMAKQGSTLAGMMDAFATSVSIALQYGVPLKDLCSKFSHMRFEPSGFTGNDQIPIAKSIMDYIFRYLAIKFLEADAAEVEDPETAETPGDASVNPNEAADATGEAPGASDGQQTDAPASGTAANGTTSPEGSSPMQETVGAPTETSSEGLVGQTVEAFMEQSESDARAPSFDNQEDAPPCANCGSITVRSGACYQCKNCGASTGCG